MWAGDFLCTGLTRRSMTAAEIQTFCQSLTRKHLERLWLHKITEVSYVIAQTRGLSFVEMLKNRQAAEESVRLSAHKKRFLPVFDTFSDSKWNQEEGYKKSKKFHWIGLTRMAFIGWKVSLSLSEFSRRISREDKNVDRFKCYKC